MKRTYFKATNTINILFLAAGLFLGSGFLSDRYRLNVCGIILFASASALCIFVFFRQVKLDEWLQEEMAKNKRIVDYFANFPAMINFRLLHKNKLKKFGIKKDPDMYTRS